MTESPNGFDRVRSLAQLPPQRAHVEELQFLDLLGRLAMRIVRIAEEAAPGARRDVRLAWPFS